MSTVERKCQKCGKSFLAKSADVKRGWAKCCSKACAAHMREKKLDRFDYQNGGQFPGTFDPRELEEFPSQLCFPSMEDSDLQP